MLPDDTLNSMLYAPKTLCVLCILNVEWEASIQYFNICNSLLSITNCAILAEKGNMHLTNYIFHLKLYHLIPKEDT